MKEEFDALFAEHQKLLGELQAMKALAQPEQEPDLGGHDVFFPIGITRPSAEEVSRKPEQEPVAYLHQCGKKPELKELSFKKNEPSLSAKGYKATPLGYLTQPQPKEPEQEPVAWAWRFHEGDWVVGVELPWFAERSGYEHRPLVFSNITPPQRKPLTDEQIDAVMPQPTEFGKVQPPWSGSDITILRAMARAIEAAHGIKE